jgi:hypothetical protein
MRVLIIFLLLLNFSSLKSQNKNGDGQYFYDVTYKLNEKSTTGKAVFLQRGHLQRLEFFINSDSSDQMRIAVFTDLIKNEYLTLIYSVNAKEIERKIGTFESLDKAPQKKEWNFFEEEETKVVNGYKCKKQKAIINLSWPCMPQVEVFSSAKINVDPRYAFKAIDPVFDFKGLPLEFNILCLGTLDVVIKNTRIEHDLPDMVWFNSETTPVYPFEKVNYEDFYKSRPALEKFSRNRLESISGRLSELSFLLTKTISDYATKKYPEKKDRLNLALSKLEIKKMSIINKINDKYSAFIQLGEDKNVESKRQASLLFTKEFTEELNSDFAEFYNDIKEISTLFSSVFETETYYPRAYLPKNEFGQVETYWGLNLKQSELLLKSFIFMAEQAEFELLLWYWEKTGKLPLSKDLFDIISIPKKASIILGESFEADIIPASRIEKSIFTASVNGNPALIKNGVAKFQMRPSTVGTHKYDVTMSVPAADGSGEMEIKRSFEFEVTIPSVVVAADKMNLLYVGINNPISVAAAGISSNDLSVSVSGEGEAEITQIGGGKYIIHPKKATSKSGFCNITLTNKKTGRQLGVYPFRVIYLPDPSVRLTNNKNGGSMTAAEMKVQAGLMALLNISDFDARCEVSSFSLQKVSNGKVQTEIKSEGGAFKGAVLESVTAAKNGDIYIFKDITSRCPGDATEREMSSLIFEIK